MGVKALIYFEIVTTAGLFIGLGVVNLTKPGEGVPLVATQTEVMKQVTTNHPRTLVETVVHAFPSSIVDALARGDILQIVAFAVFFAMAASAIGEKGKPVIRAMESLSQVMFKLTNYVMLFAPIGVAAAMATRSRTGSSSVIGNRRQASLIPRTVRSSGGSPTGCSPMAFTISGSYGSSTSS